ncbi:MAG: hypothetical protein A2Y13_10400 [Planctomycetes bacterium GWC2_45_44]|nr:MAG: hypothetical protein A2Y13_10400 [Planctomycetes bacterium GWC2_45_44]HBR20357.1 hypothetical protein [Phycisphaerales bacterium]
MKKSKIIITLVVLVLIAAAAVVVNQTVYDFYTPLYNYTGKVLASKPTEVNEPAKAVDSNTPKKDANQPADPNKTVAVKDSNDANDVNDANDPMEALNLKDVEMKDIIQKLAQWTNKVIIPNDEAMKQKITIYSPVKLPRSQALSLIYSALKVKGFIAEYGGNVIYLKPVAKARLGSVPVVSADEPLAAIENKNQVVQKFFKIKNYSPIQMSKIIMPLIGEYGYVSADENTGSLLIIDTVENLIRFEKIIAQCDVPGSDQAAEKIFEIRFGDPAEIVQLLRKLLSIDGGSPPAGNKEKTAAAPESVIIESSRTPIVLIPESRRKWIIARASADDIKRIGQWIEKLDQAGQVQSEYETISIMYVDVSEVAERLNEAMQKMPGTELKASVLVQPLRQAGQIMLFGRAEMREMLKKFIAEIDVPTGKFETKTFELKHADAEQVKKQIDDLYGKESDSGDWFSRRYGQSQQNPTDVVKAIAFPTMQQVTVVASPENMVKIVAQIAEWDVPLDVSKVKPVIIELQNSDPVRMADLLTKLFTEESSENSLPWWWWGGGEDEKKKKIVGALYGQLTFEPVPDTKKIIVISKIPEAYDVISQLIEELDKMDVAELPMVITLNYADAEDLCDQLNAILNEAGTSAILKRSKRGLSEYSTSETGQKQSDAGKETSQVNPDVITPWWNNARDRAAEQMPTSNLIGRIRFIPVHRSKAILVLSPSEYQESLKAMIMALDQPGKQVMIKVVIIEVNHENMTSLGIKLASDKAAFGNLGENALTALTQLAYTQNHGTFTATSTANINLLVDLLIREVNAKVLNQPTLWTKDNEEAEFFKGKSVPFLQSTQTSTEGLSQRDAIQYRNVGVILRVRPNITPEKAVDMTINLIISEVEDTLINGNIATNELNTTTHMIVNDGETLMLGGILFKNDSLVEQKIPLFGDMPMVGKLFRHYDTGQSNNELLAFITPYVVDTNSSPAAVKEIKNKYDKMQDVLELLGEDTNSQPGSEPNYLPDTKPDFDPNSEPKVFEEYILPVKESHQRQPGKHYTPTGLGHAVVKAIKKAFRPEGMSDEKFSKWTPSQHWHPHQLRHNAATFLRKEFGLETARTILGHRSAAITEVYAELDQQKAVEAIVKVG